MIANDLLLKAGTHTYLAANNVKARCDFVKPLKPTLDRVTGDFKGLGLFVVAPLIVILIVVWMVSNNSSHHQTVARWAGRLLIGAILLSIIGALIGGFYHSTC